MFECTYMPLTLGITITKYTDNEKKNYKLDFIFV